MNAKVNDVNIRTINQLKNFLTDIEVLDIKVAPSERYEFIWNTLRRFKYRRLRKANKSVVLSYLLKVSGYSRQHLTRLIKRVVERHRLFKRYHSTKTTYKRVYANEDVCLLAKTDSLHGNLSGATTRKIMDEGIPDLPQGRVQKAVAYFGVPSVQAEAKEDLRILQPKMDKDHGYSGAHRRETEANAQ